MRLETVSSRFDRTPMWDAYTGQLLAGRCQMTAWDNPRRDGLTTIRRTLSMKNSTRLPARRALLIGGLAWIVARFDNVDTWGRHVSRDGYIAQQAMLGKVGSTDEVLLNTCTRSYLSRVWVKDVKDISTTSEAQGQYYVYFTETEQVTEGEFVFVDSRWHLVRNIISGTAGFMVAECNELEADCITEVELQAEGAYDPVTETYSDLTNRVLYAIRTTWKDDYTNDLASNEKEQIGDVRLRFSSGDADLIKLESRLTIQGKLWQVTGIEPRKGGAVSVSLRRV